jgi:predicted ATPase
VVLGGLTTPQIGELVSGFTAGAPPYLVQALAESSGGNPFFAAEMVRHLVETGAFAVVRDTVAHKPELAVPEGVRDVIRRRLSRLTEDCGRLLTAAAVIGQQFGLLLLQNLAGTPEERLLDAMGEAVRAQLIVEAGGDRCRFAHALIRETLYDELSGRGAHGMAGSSRSPSSRRARSSRSRAARPLLL